MIDFSKFNPMTDSIDWNTLDEEGRYALWSADQEWGGTLSYPAFCDVMDNLLGAGG